VCRAYPRGRYEETAAVEFILYQVFSFSNNSGTGQTWSRRTYKRRRGAIGIMVPAIQVRPAMTTDEKP